MSLVTIRSADLEDMAAAQAVFERASLSNDGDREALLAHPDALVLDDNGMRAGRMRVAVVEGRLVGFATTAPGRGFVELVDLFVDPNWMRRGIGGRLMADLVDREHAAIEVTGNPHAARFYAAAGFVEVGQAQTAFGPAPRLRREC